MQVKPLQTKRDSLFPKVDSLDQTV
jgi:hypothetical protein